MTLKCGKCLNVVNSLSLGSIISIDTGLDGVDATDIGADRNTSLYVYRYTGSDEADRGPSIALDTDTGSARFRNRPKDRHKYRWRP